MRRAETLLALSIAIALSGCELHKQPVVRAAPAPPKPVVTPPPPPPPEPLSIPQTNVQLPAPQPLTPEAIATTEPAGEPEPTPHPPARTPTNRPSRGAAAPPRAVEPAPTPPPAVAPPAPEPERPPISEVLPANELKRLQEEALLRKQEVRKLIDQIPANRRTTQQRNTVDRIEAFLKQVEDAEHRGDMRQASELAGRALVLALELK